MKRFLLKYTTKLDSIIAFVGLEILALIAFALGSISMVFLILGIIFAVLMIPFAIKKISLDNILSLLMLSFPLIIFLLLSVVSPFGQGMYSPAENIFYLVGSIAFLVIGILTHYNKKIKMDVVILTILIAISVLTVISVLYTISRYGPFYQYLYQGKYLFYDGNPFLVTNEVKWLFGYGFVETDARLLILYVLIMCLAGVPLIFMKLKKNRLKFFLFLSVSILGLLCAILMPILEYLLFLVPVYGFALLYRFVGGKNKKGSKITKITLYSIVGVFLVGLLLFTINAQEGDNIIKSMVRQIPPLNKLFNGNDYVVPFKNVLVAQPYVFGQHEPVSFFDILFGRWNDLVVTGKDTISVLDTGSAFFDVVYEAGLVGALAIVAFIVVIINRGVKYLKSKESAANKLFIVSFIFIAFIYPIFSYMSTPKIHSFDYLSFFRSPIFFLTLFFVGRIFFDPKMEVINEK